MMEKVQLTQHLVMTESNSIMVSVVCRIYRNCFAKTWISSYTYYFINWGDEVTLAWEQSSIACSAMFY